MTSLPDLLERLLTDAAFRDDFLAGRADLPPAFQSIDPVQLERTAAQLRKDLVQRQFRGSGGLLARFPKTLAAALPVPSDAALDALFARFLASPAYRAYREWPRTGAGQCLEEAFYRFAEDAALGDPATREREFLAAIVRAVLLSPEPGFALPPELTTRNGVAFAITTRSAPHLFAATPRGLVQGALTPFLADLVREPDAAAVALRHRVAPSVLAEAKARLAALGL